jgi:hypothetical protein
MSPRQRLRIGLAVVLGAALAATAAQRPDPIDEPFKGVTTNGTVIEDLFPIQATGVTTVPVQQAAVAFIAVLTDDQRRSTTFPVDDSEWRKWNNVHRYVRQGVSFKEMTEPQRDKAFALIGAGMSAKGLQKSRNIMRLNEHLAELTKRFEEYGEGLYHLTVMGEPSATQPWGWQLDGHHLVVNYFVLRDQVVMTPTFMGSEPVIAESGKYAGTRVLQDEQNKGLALMQSLNAAQQARATLQPAKTANNALAQAFRDNLVLDYAGIRAAELDQAQRAKLLETIAEYIENMDSGHAKVKMDEVRRHLDQTYFAWIGGAADDSVFYYRIQSPVILIEFDHQTPVALDGPRTPGRRHVHAVVRTPNGNDYGRDLLRQHYLQHRNDVEHGHRR